MRLPALALLDVSTGHVSAATERWLNGSMTINSTGPAIDGNERHWLEHRNPALIVIPWNAGWFLFCSEPTDAFGAIPEDIRRILNLARRAGADWIKLDEDGTVHETLPWYDG